ncbi:hypothetical protein I7I51_08967 [Histoplasma capsulatum]|uniref:Uncharacterized protein n=2 Tax=Histoplasma TaxID=5036 RepID=A0A8A1M504_AJECA|nr:hypothetical protein I7I51_08967 [Histoplasma capsulatum]
MLNTESRPRHPSPIVRNLTFAHSHSTSQLPNGKRSIYSMHGDNTSSIDAPTASKLGASSKTTTCSKTQTNTYPRPIHHRAKTEILSFPSTKPSPNGGVYLDLEEVNLEPSIPENPTSPPKLNRQRTLFKGLFQGGSALVPFGQIPSYNAKEKNTCNADRTDKTTQMAEPLSSQPQSRFTKRISMPSPLRQMSSTSRFSLFGSKTQDSKQNQLPDPAVDEFLNLDASSELFPDGSTDLPTPEAFKSLQHNAERTIRRLQSAYKSRTFALHQTLAEKSSLGEELQETHSRLRNIKNQLDGMAERVHEQDKAMKAMAEELKLERQMRQEEEEARQRNIILDTESEPSQDHNSDHSCNCTIRERARDGLEVKSINRHNKRSSGVTFSSDSGFESSDESIAESIFSRKYDNPDSPSTLATRASGTSSPDISVSVGTQPPVPSKSPKPAPKPSAYDRMLRSISSANLGVSLMGSSAFSTSKCSNCHGATASDAWGVVSVLQEENRGLKNRIEELEVAIDECITLVGG